MSLSIPEASKAFVLMAVVQLHQIRPTSARTDSSRPAKCLSREPLSAQRAKMPFDSPQAWARRTQILPYPARSRPPLAHPTCRYKADISAARSSLLGATLIDRSQTAQHGRADLRVTPGHVTPPAVANRTGAIASAAGPARPSIKKQRSGAPQSIATARSAV